MARALWILLALAAPADARPGRWFSVSLGGGYTPVLRPDPDVEVHRFLVYTPETQLGWGWRAGSFLISTRFDLFGIPLVGGGGGLDIGGAWAPALGERRWGPAVRLMLGGFSYAAGSGPDYEAKGMRLQLDGGVTTCLPGAKPEMLGCFAVWGGVEEKVVFIDKPCDVSWGCHEVLLGPTLRGEFILMF